MAIWEYILLTNTRTKSAQIKGPKEFVCVRGWGGFRMDEIGGRGSWSVILLIMELVQDSLDMLYFYIFKG